MKITIAVEMVGGTKEQRERLDAAFRTAKERAREAGMDDYEAAMYAAGCLARATALAHAGDITNIDVTLGLAGEPSGPCPKCGGCGQVADTEDQEPWTAWRELPAQSSLAVLTGLVKPIPCPACQGKGAADATR